LCAAWFAVGSARRRKSFETESFSRNGSEYRTVYLCRFWEVAVTPDMKIYCEDEETLEDDVNYGIADCRRRLRSQRSTLRAQHHPPQEEESMELEEAVIT
jgi:hypothetical protein